MGSLTAITKKHMEEEDESNKGGLLRQIILGGQDGLVNVFGIVLGVATATENPQLVIIAGLAATLAESLSMAAVAYTSSRAEEDHYKKMLEVEKWEIENLPDIEKEEIRIIYRKKGFKGKDLEKIADIITSDKNLWLQVMMQEELGFSDIQKINPPREGVVVGLSAFFGSLIPLFPFLLSPSYFTPSIAFWVSILFSLFFLFVAGVIKGKLTTGRLLHDGLEMMLIGGIAGIAGYSVGAVLGVAGF